MNDISEPLEEGKIVFDKIQEGQSDGDHVIISFNPPLVVDYTVWQKKDPKTGEEMYKEKAEKMAFFTFDFGMTGQVALTPENNFLINGYDNLSKDSTPFEILVKTIQFDLFHAFCHCDMDPNYTSYHWALFGNLKDRAKVDEKLS